MKKMCIQIGNPDIAIVEIENPKFCEGCNEYFLNTEQMISAILSIKNMKTVTPKIIKAGIYS